MDSIQEQFKEWVYRFQIDLPANMDRQVLVVLRARYVESDANGWEQQYLTRDGWRDYQPYEVMDYDAMIFRTGMQAIMDRQSIERMRNEMLSALRVEVGEDVQVIVDAS